MAIGGIALNRIGHVKEVFVDNNHPGFFIGLVIVFGAIIFVISLYVKFIYFIFLFYLKYDKIFF
jgi:hypothetical protein